MHPEQYMMAPEHSRHLYSPTNFLHFTQSPGLLASPKPSLRKISSNTTGRCRSQYSIFVYQSVSIWSVEGVGVELTLSFSFASLALLRFAADLTGGDSPGFGSTGAMDSSTVGDSSHEGSGGLS